MFTWHLTSPLINPCTHFIRTDSADSLTHSLTHARHGIHNAMTHIWFTTQFIPGKMEGDESPDRAPTVDPPDILSVLGGTFIHSRSSCPCRSYVWDCQVPHLPLVSLSCIVTHALRLPFLGILCCLWRLYSRVFSLSLSPRSSCCHDIIVDRLTQTHPTTFFGMSPWVLPLVSPSISVPGRGCSQHQMSGVGSHTHTQSLSPTPTHVHPLFSVR